LYENADAQNSDHLSISFSDAKPRSAYVAVVVVVAVAAAVLAAAESALSALFSSSWTTHVRCLLGGEAPAAAAAVVSARDDDDGMIASLAVQYVAVAPPLCFSLALSLAFGVVLYCTTVVCDTKAASPSLRLFR